jgi:hypothetical protein
MYIDGIVRLWLIYGGCKLRVIGRMQGRESWRFGREFKKRGEMSKVRGEETTEITN